MEKSGDGGRWQDKAVLGLVEVTEMTGQYWCAMTHDGAQKCASWHLLVQHEFRRILREIGFKKSRKIVAELREEIGGVYGEG